MALLTNYSFYIDYENGLAYKSYKNFEQVPTPVFYDGDTARLKLFLVKPSGRSDIPFFNIEFPSSSITAAVGTPGGTAAASGTTWTSITNPTVSFSNPILSVPIDATGGYYTITITNTSPSLSATTAPIPFDADPGRIKTAIDAILTITNNWTIRPNSIEVRQLLGGRRFSIWGTATNVDTNRYVLSFGVGTSAVTAQPGYDGELAFTGSGVDTLLGSNAEVESTFEVQVLDGTKYQTYLQIPCILRKQVTTP